MQEGLEQADVVHLKGLALVPISCTKSVLQLRSQLQSRFEHLFVVYAIAPETMLVNETHVNAVFASNCEAFGWFDSILMNFCCFACEDVHPGT